MSQPRPAGIRQIVLVGLMGSGKTTVGALIAARLGWPLRDSDVQLQDASGQTAREMRDAQGTDALHEAEALALFRALAQPGSGVICAAASTIEHAGVGKALAAPDVAVIWLTAPPEVLAARFANDPHRPIYGPDQTAVAAARAERRDPLYAALNPITIEVDGLAPAAVAELALDGLRRRYGELGPPRV